MARVKPARWASASRGRRPAPSGARRPGPAHRRPPDRSAPGGRPPAEASARAMARSAAGSVMLMPPRRPRRYPSHPAGLRPGNPTRPTAVRPGRRRCPARGADVPVPRPADQRLHLDQQRAPALQDRHHHSARECRPSIAQQQLAGIAHGAQTVFAHFEDADLTGRTETVLDGGEHAHGMVTITVEGEHGVDQVLDRPGSGQVAVLGHMAHQHDRHARYDLANRVSRSTQALT